MTPQERARLAAFRNAKAGASLVLLLALLTLGGLAVLAVVSPALVFQSPLMAFTAPALIAIVWLRHAPHQWMAAGKDIQQGAVDTITGPVILRQRGRPGLFAGTEDILLAGDRRFSIEPAIADELVSGREASVRFAPLSGAFLSIDAPNASSVQTPALTSLTRRERTLLGLIAEGLTDKEIARRLNLSPSTVRTYNSALYGRLGVTSRTQAIRLASGSD